MVSVIIPAWGDTPWLSEAVASVRRQTYAAVELIVSAPPEDGPRTALAARMEGVRRSHGDYVTFVDADDWLDDCAIEEMVAAIGNADVLCTGLIRGSEVRRPTADIWACGPGDVFNAMCGKLFRREVLFGLELDLSVRMGEDLMLVAQALHRAHGIVTTDLAVYHYRDNPDSVTHRQDGRARVADLSRVGAILRRNLPDTRYDAFHDRVTRDAMLLWCRYRLLNKGVWCDLRGRLKGGLLDDPRHGLLKKGALFLANCLFDR